MLPWKQLSSQQQHLKWFNRTITGKSSQTWKTDKVSQNLLLIKKTRDPKIFTTMEPGTPTTSFIGVQGNNMPGVGPQFTTVPVSQTRVSFLKEVQVCKVWFFFCFSMSWQKSFVWIIKFKKKVVAFYNTNLKSSFYCAEHAFCVWRLPSSKTRNGHNRWRNLSATNGRNFNAMFWGGRNPGCDGYWHRGCPLSDAT